MGVWGGPRRSQKVAVEEKVEHRLLPGEPRGYVNRVRIGVDSGVRTTGGEVGRWIR